MNVLLEHIETVIVEHPNITVTTNNKLGKLHGSQQTIALI